jgi:hypothetical protein
MPDEVISRAIQFLTPDELAKFVTGVDLKEVGYNEALAVTMKALKGLEFQKSSYHRYNVI